MTGDGIALSKLKLIYVLEVFVKDDIEDVLVILEPLSASVNNIIKKCEWLSNLIPLFTEHVIIHPCLD